MHTYLVHQYRLGIQMLIKIIYALETMHGQSYVNLS